MITESEKSASARYRAKQKALGIKPKPLTQEQKAVRAAKISAKRHEAKIAGVVLSTDQWAKNNPDKQRARVAKWRSENTVRSSELTRNNQASRRSTPWGKITNRMWTFIHYGARNPTARRGKYSLVLGYTSIDLRSHLESQFLEGMAWENWGDVWEVDHIKPVSAFKYISLADPLFIQCWSLSNLRPLWRDANRKKSATH